MDMNMSSSSTSDSPDLDTLAMREQEQNKIYKKEIWNCLLKKDAEKPPFHLQSPQLAYRGALVHKLRDVAKKLDLNISTLHSAVTLLDLFMDAHSLQSGRLTHVALACLSLAAKVEEDVISAPSLKTLSIASETDLNAKTFRQIEWMVGQHVQWKLLTPTPVSYAALLVDLVVTETDYIVYNNRMLEKKLRLLGAQKIDAYLDLTLSDVRLKAVEPVLVGSACVSCAREDLELNAWTFQLRMATNKQYVDIAPIKRRLHKMMSIVKMRQKRIRECNVDQGYSSARTTPNLTPNTSPSNEFRQITTNFFTNYRDKVNQVRSLQKELSSAQKKHPPSNIGIVVAPLSPQPSSSTSSIRKRKYESEDTSDSESLSSSSDHRVHSDDVEIKSKKIYSDNGVFNVSSSSSDEAATVSDKE